MTDAKVKDDIPQMTENKIQDESTVVMKSLDVSDLPEKGDQSVDESKHNKLRLVNSIAFVICMLFNALAQRLAPKSLGEISDQWDLPLRPASWAFAIWSIIYLLLAVFTVYQALPNRWVKTRNNDLMVNKIGWIYPINLMLNSLWLVVFEQNASWAFGLALAVIIGMLVTQIIILRQLIRTLKLNVVEFISLRIGFTIYSGWVMAASIINTTYFLKSVGMEEPNAGFTESVWTIIVLYVALVIYWAATFMERNPLFGCVYLWVIFAIKSEMWDDADIVTNCVIILIVHAVFIALVTGYCIYEKRAGKCKHGLFYL